MGDLVIGLARTDNLQEFHRRAERLITTFDISRYTTGLTDERSAFEELFNAVAGLKEGLQKYPLKKSLTGLAPVKAILIRLLFKQLINQARMFDQWRKGNKVSLTAFINACIACGKELEALR